MRASFIFTVVIMLFNSLIVSSANAALITETWDFRVTGKSGTFLTKGVGDILSLNFTFDDTSLKAYHTDDAGVRTGYCAGTGPYDADCLHTYPAVSMMANIVSFSGFAELLNYDDMFAWGGSIRERSLSRNFRYSADGTEFVELLNELFVLTTITDSLDGSADTGVLLFSYSSPFGSYTSSTYYVEFVSRSLAQEVSEPSSIALFALISIFMFRRLNRL